MQDCRVMSACKPSQRKRAAEFQTPIAGAHLAAKVPILVLCHAGKRGLRLNPHLLHLPHFQLLQAQSASRQLNVCSRLFHIMCFMWWNHLANADTKAVFRDQHAEPHSCPHMKGAPLEERFG